MNRGRVTIPTDADFVEGTKKYIEKWGADAVRDCDGTELPADADKLADKVYKTYFVVRGDNEYAYAHDEYMQNIALISERYTAFSDVLEIDLLKGLFAEQVRVNTTGYKKYWQVFDRTTGKQVYDWEYVGDNKVVVSNAVKMHEYTVNFFGYSLWDATQVYNYNCNGWTIEKDRDMDPVYPQALEHMLDNLDKWLAENPHVKVVRFTTFFYHFFLLYITGTRQKLFDWYNYAMAASPAMFEKFYREYGYEITLEDLLTEGYYGNHFLIPGKANADFRDMVQRFVARTAAKIVERVHAAGKEAMMFWGDNWIGAEPYGKYFSEIGLDAVVGSVASGCTVRAVSDIPGLKCREIRLMPYFFPDTLYDDEVAAAELRNNWAIERRALLRKPVDRIGFGGYLRLADKFPRFCDAVKDLCDEFRTIYGIVDNRKPYSALKVAVLSYYGREKSWMTYMSCQDAPYQRSAPYLGVLEALAGLPADIDFIGFGEAVAGGLRDYDVVFNLGDSGTAFSGGDCWKDERLVAAVREYIAGGGGFIGVGEPSAVRYGGRFFQLADALGVDKENALSILFNRYNVQAVREHFITADGIDGIDYADGTDHVFAADSALILDARYARDFPCGTNCCHVKMAVNEYGGGRCFYLAGMKYGGESSRMLYRAMLWCAHKEDELYKAFSTNVGTECHYYPESATYAVVNNTDLSQATVFYDMNGKARELILEPGEIKWITE